MKHIILSIRKQFLAGWFRAASFAAPLVVCAFALFCSKDYNPFSDLQNARAHVLSWSFAGRDSVPVYTTGTLEIGVALREKVDSFTVMASHNRFWPDTTVRRPATGATLDAEPFTFSISFCDTGMETVSVRTHRSSGGTVTEDLFIRSTLPLHQPDLAGFFGVPFVLFTPPVGDKDVFYQWDFGPGRLVKSSGDSATAVLVSGISSGTATLRVTDLSGNHASPCRSFVYLLKDTSHAVIRCLNDSLHGDTIVTRDSVLAFKAEIFNYGDKPADSCWVNQSVFDISYPQSLLYIKLFKDISAYDRGHGPLQITVYAIGNRQFPSRKSSKTFWAVFDTAGASNLGADLDFIVPLKDSSGVAVRDYRVFGVARNYRGDSMVLRVTVNDSQYPASRVTAGASGTWEWPVRLDSSVNSISVTAYDAAGRQKLISKHVTIAYDSAMQDRVKPVIWEISVNGQPAQGLFTRLSNVPLQVIAFDEGVGMQSVTVNGTALSGDSTGYLWRQTIALAHSPLGNKIAVSAMDRNGNKNDTTVFIFQNSPPVLDSAAVAPVPAIMYAGRSYAFRIPCKDADNDPVSVVPVDTPVTMTVSRNGAVSWTPSAQDAGPGRLSVLLNDGYESSGPFTWTFVCIDSSKPVVPVRFTTREKDFPAVLQAGGDTLSIRLATDSNVSGARLLYSAAFIDRPAVLFTNDTSPIVVWAPGDADTGYRQLRITVGNGSMNFDTINPVVRVVARNRFACHLTHTFTGDTTPAGELALFSTVRPETLSFVIHDSDDIATEKYTVAILRHGMRSVAVLNKRDFTVILTPDTASEIDTLSELDTLFVAIRDMTGTSDSATFVIRNTSVLHAKKLRLNTTATGANVAGNVVDFPLLVRLNTGNFDFSQAQMNGGDVRFSRTNGSSLPFEIERFDAQNGIAEIWVRLDTVYGNDSTHAIVMSWGLPANPLNPPDHNVFDTAKGYAGVWHLNETGGTTINDATAFGRNGTKPAAASPTPVQGIIGGAQQFNGTTDWINLGVDKSFVNNVSQVTMSAWVNLRTINAAINSGILSFSTNSTNQGPCDAAAGVHSRASFEIQSPGVVAAIGRTPDNSCKSQEISSLTLQPGMFNYVATVTDFAASRIDIYINGNLVSSSGTVAFTTTATDNTNSLYASIGADDEGKKGFVDGVIDEAEVSRTARSADWIKLCYMNQQAVDALLTFR